MFQIRFGGAGLFGVGTGGSLCFHPCARYVERVSRYILVWMN